jgi:hypothetical protein
VPVYMEIQGIFILAVRSTVGSANRGGVSILVTMSQEIAAHIYSSTTKYLRFASLYFLTMTQELR